jgi:hypothetical protein
MGWPQLREKYQGHDTRTILNMAVRREIPGGDHLIHGSQQLHEALQNARERTPEEMHALRQLREIAESLLDRAREEILRRYECGAHGKHSPATAAPPPVIRLADLAPKPAAKPPDDPRTWTPPAAIVARMGKEPTEQLARECGVSPQLIRGVMSRLGIDPPPNQVESKRWTPAMDKLLGTRAMGELAKLWGFSDEAVRRRMLKLGIAAERRKSAWTPERRQLLRDTPDNAEAAKLLGLSIAAVKTARSRLARKTPAAGGEGG